MSKNLVFQISDRFMIAVHNNINPSAEEWNAYVESFLQGAVTEGSLVYTEGGSPSATQRKQLRDALTQQGTQDQPAAILTDSLVARTAITALKAPPDKWPQFKQILEELKRGIGLR